MQKTQITVAKRMNQHVSARFEARQMTQGVFAQHVPVEERQGQRQDTFQRRAEGQGLKEISRVLNQRVADDVQRIGQAGGQLCLVRFFVSPFSEGGQQGQEQGKLQDGKEQQ